MTLMFLTSWKSRLTRLLPIKPAAPVTRTVFPSRFMLYFTMFSVYRGYTFNTESRQRSRDVEEMVDRQAA